MIENEQQYEITLDLVEKFRAAIAGLVHHNIHPRLLQAEREGLESQLQDLEAELQEYLTKQTP